MTHLAAWVRQTHRHDHETGVWTKTNRDTYTNYDGHEIRRERRGWGLYAPDGQRLTPQFLVEPTVIAAKLTYQHS